MSVQYFYHWSNFCLGIVSKISYAGFETYLPMQGLFLYTVYFKDTSEGNHLIVSTQRDFLEYPVTQVIWLCRNTTTKCVYTEGRAFIERKKCLRCGKHHVLLIQTPDTLASTPKLKQEVASYSQDEWIAHSQENSHILFHNPSFLHWLRLLYSTT